MHQKSYFNRIMHPYIVTISWNNGFLSMNLVSYLDLFNHHIWMGHLEKETNLIWYTSKGNTWVMVSYNRNLHFYHYWWLQETCRNNAHIDGYQYWRPKENGQSDEEFACWTFKTIAIYRIALEFSFQWVLKFCWNFCKKVAHCMSYFPFRKVFFPKDWDSFEWWL